MKDSTKGYIRNGVEYGDRPAATEAPSEASEQQRLVTHLRRCGVYCVHVPNGGARSRGSGAAMARLGAIRGFCDLLVLDSPPPGFLRAKGVALELKRAVRSAKASEAQVAALEALALRGWLATVQWGADAALEYLRRAGYDV